MGTLVDVAVGANLDIRTQRGQTFDLTFTVSPGTQDYTGKNLKMVARLGFSGAELFTIRDDTLPADGQITGEPEGRLHAVVPFAKTALWVPRTYVYTASIETPAGVWEPTISGFFIVTPNPEYV